MKYFCFFAAVFVLILMMVNSCNNDKYNDKYIEGFKLNTRDEYDQYINKCGTGLWCPNGELCNNKSLPSNNQNGDTGYLRSGLRGGPSSGGNQTLIAKVCMDDNDNVLPYSPACNVKSLYLQNDDDDEMIDYGYGKQKYIKYDVDPATADIMQYDFYLPEKVCVKDIQPITVDPQSSDSVYGHIISPEHTDNSRFSKLCKLTQSGSCPSECTEIDYSSLKTNPDTVAQRAAVASNHGIRNSNSNFRDGPFGQNGFSSSGYLDTMFMGNITNDVDKSCIENSGNTVNRMDSSDSISEFPVDPDTILSSNRLFSNHKFFDDYCSINNSEVHIVEDFHDIGENITGITGDFNHCYVVNGSNIIQNSVVSGQSAGVIDLAENEFLIIMFHPNMNRNLPNEMGDNPPVNRIMIEDKDSNEIGDWIGVGDWRKRYINAQNAKPIKNKQYIYTYPDISQPNFFSFDPTESTIPREQLYTKIDLFSKINSAVTPNTSPQQITLRHVTDQFRKESNSHVNLEDINLVISIRRVNTANLPYSSIYGNYNDAEIGRGIDDSTRDQISSDVLPIEQGIQKLKSIYDVVIEYLIGCLDNISTLIDHYVNLSLEPDGSLNFNQLTDVVDEYYRNLPQIIPNRLKQEMDDKIAQNQPLASTQRIYILLRDLFYGDDLSHASNVETHLSEITGALERLSSDGQIFSGFDPSDRTGGGFLDALIQHDLNEIKTFFDNEVSLFKNEANNLLITDINSDNAVSSTFIFHCLNIMNISEEIERIKEENDFYSAIKNDKADGLIDYTMDTLLTTNQPTGTSSVLCNGSTWLTNYGNVLNQIYDHDETHGRSSIKDDIRNRLLESQYMDYEQGGDQCNFSRMHSEDASDPATIDEVNRCITRDLKNDLKTQCKNKFNALIESRKTIPDDDPCSYCKPQARGGDIERCKTCIQSLDDTFLNTGYLGIPGGIDTRQSRNDLNIGQDYPAWHYNGNGPFKIGGPFTQQICDIKNNQNKLFSDPDQNGNCPNQGPVGQDFASYLVN